MSHRHRTRSMSPAQLANLAKAHASSAAKTAARRAEAVAKSEAAQRMANDPAIIRYRAEKSASAERLAPVLAEAKAELLALVSAQSPRVRTGPRFGGRRARIVVRVDPADALIRALERQDGSR